MPGVIMENGNRHGAHTNHDRDRLPNGVNGGTYPDSRSQEKGKGPAEPQQNVTPTSPSVPNGLNGAFDSIPNLQRHLDSGPIPVPSDLRQRLNELPPEIAHITQGYMPLSMLLKRLAEKTHHGLSQKIMELASMPVPASAQHAGPSGLTEVDDLSPENLAKKKTILSFAQSTHADWVKALVITNWSRRSEDVSKTIDLNVYTNQQKALYDMAIHEMAELKRGLGPARLPNPDLKTALQILSTGKAPYMPDLGYLEPPPLTARDLLKELENLNTLLSIRLNLNEYDNIPISFKNYVINSGRVTFKVPGEFELDLTIADEAPESQFWFIDFRFLFSPAVQEIPYALRFHIESRVNSVLLAEGLSGCYRVLHEITLTHKISEFRRQAFDLSRSKWIDGLKVEALNRSLSIQYWLDRYTKGGPKSWIIIGVHSGRRKDGRPDAKATSHLSIRWFRDGKEVKDAKIPFDSVNISTEALLKTIIGKHIDHIMTSTHQQLALRPLFADGDASLSLTISPDEPAESVLKVQLTRQEHVAITIEPITGRFIFGPATVTNSRMENFLNKMSKDPAKESAGYIENLRYETVDQEITNHALSVGWTRFSVPLSQEVVKTRFPKGTSRLIWLRRLSWKEDWYMLVSVSMGGECWWLVETAPDTTTNVPNGLKISSLLRMPLQAKLPVPTYKFLSTLNLYAAALISHFTNLKVLHFLNSQHKLRNNKRFLPIRVPSIYIKLSQILESKNRSPRTGKAWANDTLKLTFLGLEASSTASEKDQNSTNPSNLSTLISQGVLPPKESQSVFAKIKMVVVTEARIIIPDSAALSILGERFDKDIAFDSKSGSFAVRIRSKVGEPVITPLIENLNRIEQFVDFVNVLDKHKDVLHSEPPSLNKLVFTYGPISPLIEVDSPMPRPYKAKVSFGAVNTSLKLELDTGNPHLRISDFLTKVLNGKLGLDSVATLLPITLPALSALDTIERHWAGISEKGSVIVFVRAVEWYIACYTIEKPSLDGSLALSRKVLLDIKVQTRKGEAWWYIRRTDTHAKDEIDAALKSIWDSNGDGWQGMRISAVAQPRGVEDLLGQIDAVLRAVEIMDPPPAPIAPVAPMQQTQPQSQAPAHTMPRGGGGNRQQMHNAQRQQPPLNHNQGNNQGRHNTQTREVVEID